MQQPAVRVELMCNADGGETFGRLFFEEAPIGTMAVNAAGDIVALNAQLAAIFGYNRQELLGKPYDILLPQRLRQRHSDLYAEFLEKPRARLMGLGRDLVGVNKKGAELVVEIGMNSVPSPGGELVLLTVADIAERRRAERAGRVNAQLQSLMRGYDNMGIAAAIISQTGYFQEANNTFEGIRAGYILPSDRIKFIEQVTHDRFSQALLAGIRLGTRQYLWVPATGGRSPAWVLLLPIAEAYEKNAPLPGTFVVLLRPTALTQSPKIDVLRQLFNLTPTEARVATHFASGYPTQDVADQMGISKETVRSHLSHVFRKIGVRSQAQLVALIAALMTT